jgi:hypothetical protein
MTSSMLSSAPRVTTALLEASKPQNVTRASTTQTQSSTAARRVQQATTARTRACLSRPSAQQASTAVEELWTLWTVRKELSQTSRERLLRRSASSVHTATTTRRQGRSLRTQELLAQSSTSAIPPPLPQSRMSLTRSLVPLERSVQLEVLLLSSALQEPTVPKPPTLVRATTAWLAQRTTSAQPGAWMPMTLITTVAQRVTTIDAQQDTSASQGLFTSRMWMT